MVWQEKLDFIGIAADYDALPLLAVLQTQRLPSDLRTYDHGRRSISSTVRYHLARAKHRARCPATNRPQSALFICHAHQRLSSVLDICLCSIIFTISRYQVAKSQFRISCFHRRKLELCSGLKSLTRPNGRLLYSSFCQDCQVESQKTESADLPSSQ